MLKQKKSEINQIKNHSSLAIDSVHKWTFSFFLVVETVINFLVNLLPTNSKLEEIFKLVILILIDVCLYFALFKFVKLLHNKYIESSRRKLKISGTWYHVHIPKTLDSVDYTHDKLSAGETVISRELKDFTFVGHNYSYYLNEKNIVHQLDDVPNTCWETVTSEVCEESNSYDIIEVYRATSRKPSTTTIDTCPCCGHKYKNRKEINEANQNRYGIHQFVVKDPNKHIFCSYSDCVPSIKSGYLYLFKNIEDRDNKIKEYFEKQKEVEASEKY